VAVTALSVVSDELFFLFSALDCAEEDRDASVPGCLRQLQLRKKPATIIVPAAAFN